ncbi:MAG TPA: GIY-YIG nuclease family protein [Gemmatales bacterium]|nr:GIY-YIG nuclease family protein [Gemmatales bacterium]
MLLRPWLYFVKALSEFEPLFSDKVEEGDTSTGYIYVLRSKSDHPFIVENRSVIHKIGLTVGEVKARIGNAAKEPTYLLADVEVVLSYQLANMNLAALEALLHKFFASARLDMELKDRFGFAVVPQEWFLVPLPVIEEAIQKIMDGTLREYQFDPKRAQLVRT